MNYKKLIEVATAKGISEIEIRVQKKSSKEISLFDKELDKYEVSNLEKVIIRGAYNGKLAKINSENLSNNDIDSLLDILIDNCKSITSEEPYVIYEGSKKYSKTRKPAKFANISMEIKLNNLHRLRDEISARDSRISKFELTYNETEEKVQLFNSKGLSLKKHYAYGVYVVSAVIEDQGDIRSEFRYQIKSKYEDFDFEKIVNNMVERLTKKLHPVQIESNQYPVVLENTVSTDLLASFVSIFSGMSAIRNMTLLKDKVGQKIVGSNITIIDDPFDANGIFQHSFDDQGVACKKREIIAKGVLKTLLHDLKTAQILGVEPTGHGFGGDISPTNMYLKIGNKTLEELVAPIEDGIFITELSGLHAGLNPVSGEFSAQASGYRIENGKITYPISLIVLSGNFIEMLNNVEEIGADLYISFSGIGAPSLKIKSMSVSGK